MNFILIGLCLGAGLLLRSTRILPENAHAGINTWILWVALPCVALLYIPTISWSGALILPMAMPLLVWGGAWLAVTSLSKLLALDKSTQAALLLTAGLGNTSFVGFPLTQAYLGNEGLRIAVICDQISFITLSTLGVFTALHAVHGAAALGKMVRRIFRFPPFLTFVVALILPKFVSLAPIEPLLRELAGTLVPLALFSVGSQIRFSEWRDEAPALSLGLAYKLFMAPALVLCAALLLRLKGVVPQASVLEAAMAPMITAAILATEYKLNPRLSNLMVSIGILVSIPTTGAWYLVMRSIL